MFLANRGFYVFPCRRGTKLPATTNGFKDATTDEAQIRRWFDNDRGYNLAVATGPQPNGINLVAIDIDPLKGGDVAWGALLNGHTVPPGPVHITRSGGTHLFFDAPTDLFNTSGRLGVGIDTRGVGGYVVVPPSQVVDAETGEIGHYDSTRETVLGRAPTPPMPTWLVESLQDQIESMARHPSQQPLIGVLDFGDSVADLARRDWVWPVELDRDGWTRVRGRGGDGYWSRPGKNPREGHSAVLHGDDGPLVVFTTERPAGGRATAHGEGASFSPWDYIVAYRADGDTRRAAALVRGPGVAPTRWRAATSADAVSDDTPGDEGVPLFPPPEFYEQREWLAACQQMAQASGIAPAAMTLAYLIRWATLIPPPIAIPAINGARGTFDLIGVVAGTSGAGKSAVMRRAAEMLPVQNKALRMDMGIGSGEGIIERFYDMVPAIGEDGKTLRSKVRARVIAGVHFSIDEGVLLAELSGRAGTTHISRLCTAWSGGVLSTANASAENFRHIDAGQYRLTAMMAIQADRAHELMTDSLASQGFVGRLLFAWAEEPPVRPRPCEPDPFELPVPSSTPRVMSYPQAVEDELIDRHDARRGTDVPVEEHHHDLLRVKVAGQLAQMDGHFDAVSMDDWALATTLVDCSANVRRHLYAHRRQRDQQTRQARVIARAEDEITVEDVKERRGVASLAKTLPNLIRKHGPMTESQLRKRVRSDLRHRFPDALDRAVHDAELRLSTDGRIDLA